MTGRFKHSFHVKNNPSLTAKSDNSLTSSIQGNPKFIRTSRNNQEYFSTTFSNGKSYNFNDDLT